MAGGTESLRADEAWPVIRQMRVADARRVPPDAHGMTDGGLLEGELESRRAK